MKWIFIVLAVLVLLGLVAYLATSGSRRAKQAERDRLEAARIREQAADRQHQVAQQEAAAAQVQADAAGAQAAAERQAREAERKRQGAEAAQAESQRAREAHQEQLRQADLMDPDIRTDAQGNRLDDVAGREEVSTPPHAESAPQRNVNADYQTTLQPQVTRDEGSAAASYSEYPTEMSQRERLLRQEQEIDLRDSARTDQASGHDGRRLADRIMDRDNPSNS